jgi:hypothetical protein
LIGVSKKLKGPTSKRARIGKREKERTADSDEQTAQLRGEDLQAGLQNALRNNITLK